MTPEQIQQLLERVETLERQMREFTSAPELSPNIKRTLSTILSTASAKTPASATRAVSEGGSNSYNVMYPPTGFIKIGDYDVPYI